MKRNLPFILLACLMLCGCQSSQNKKPQKSESVKENLQPGTFGYDLEFLNKYQKTIVLKREDAQVAIIPAYQGRVMTSTATGHAGMSFGWINYKLIQSGGTTPHFNNYGGEERFWLGPEGGQFSIFFPPGVPFAFEHWQVPAPIDTEPFDLVSSNDTSAVFTRNIRLLNYSKTEFNLRVDRTVLLPSPDQIREKTGITLPSGVHAVAYETTNRITNTGNAAWTKEGGLLSIWMLGQLISSPTNIVLVPFVEGPEDQLGPVVNDTYFGKVPADRLKIVRNLILFRADGLQRGKIGLNPKRATKMLGSFDTGQNVLTLLIYSKPEEYEGYVNSMWEIQSQPFSGDVVNSYNDGPLEDGSQMGPFYELEASSPAKSLKPGESLEHVNMTFHITGDPAGMDSLLKSLFGISAGELRNIFTN
jgi:hypothetical protein